MDSHARTHQLGRHLYTPGEADGLPGVFSSPAPGPRRQAPATHRRISLPFDLETRVVELAALPSPDLGDLAWMTSPAGRLAIEIAAAVVPMDRVEAAARRLLRATVQVRAGTMTPSGVLADASRARPPARREGRHPRIVLDRLVATETLSPPPGHDPFPGLAAGLATATCVSLAQVQPERLAAAAGIAVELAGPPSSVDRDDPLRRLRPNGTRSRRLARALHEDLVPTHAAATRVSALLIGPEGRTEEGLLRWWASGSPTRAPMAVRLRWCADLLDLDPRPEADENRRRRARREARQEFARQISTTLPEHAAAAGLEWLADHTPDRDGTPVEGAGV
jgi:hypothetical protein